VLDEYSGLSLSQLPVGGDRPTVALALLAPEQVVDVRQV
tara:strand:+ start:239 stop:355 length:117 start_codon:yes stop_codon:yes gene_type:complete